MQVSLINEINKLRTKIKKCTTAADFDKNDTKILEFTHSIPKNIYNIETAYSNVREISQQEEEQFEDNRYNWSQGVGGHRNRTAKNKRKGGIKSKRRKTNKTLTRKR